MADKEEKKQLQMADKDNLFAKMLKRLNEIFEKYMSQYPRYNELREFMRDEKNLYDEDGAIKEEYKLWIDDVEEFSKTHPIKDTLAESHKDDQLWSAVFTGIEKYIHSDYELLSIYEEAKSKEGETFDVEEWIYNQIKETSKDDKEADKKFDVLADMFSNETLNLLDRNTELRKILKDRVEEYGTE